MFNLYVGIDEVGRGCIAGPVVAGAVLFPPLYNNSNIKDSKTLTRKRREALADEIYANALAFGIGEVSSYLVDEIGIVPATKLAMYRALYSIKVPYESVIIDAVPLLGLTVPSINPFKADRDYLAVSAASIIAKIYRDNLMSKLYLEYPEYGWDTNMGYPTKKHFLAIEKYGVTPLHRKTFLKSIKI